LDPAEARHKTDPLTLQHVDAVEHLRGHMEVASGMMPGLPFTGG
jgi:hypothetical protein